MSLNEDASGSEASPSAAQETEVDQPAELKQLMAENTALRGALLEEEKRNAELLALVRRADKEMQDITQRDRDLAARLGKWREEVRSLNSVRSHLGETLSDTSLVLDSALSLSTTARRRTV